MSNHHIMKKTLALRALAIMGTMAFSLVLFTSCESSEDEAEVEAAGDESGVVAEPVDYVLTGKVTIRSKCTDNFRLLPETITMRSTLESENGYVVVGSERVMFTETTSDGRTATYRITVAYDPSRGRVRGWTVPAIDEDICAGFTAECPTGKTCGIEKVKEITRTVGWSDPTTTYDQVVTCDCM
jgi:hypothetical protein